MDNFEQRQFDVYSQFMEGRIKAFYREVYALLIVYAERLLWRGLSYLAEDCVQMPCSRPMASAARCALPPT